MRNDSKRNGSTGKAILSAVCIIMSIIIVGLCLQLFGRGKAKPSEWFNKGDNVGDSSVGGGMILPDHNEPQGAQAASGISLYSAELPAVAFAENGVSTEAESAYTVTATVSPDNNAMNTAIEWSLAWQNASSEWASGKTLADYVTATPSGEGVSESKTVTVACYQSFGEPIILTAKCKYDETVQASIQIDYAPKLTMTEYVATNLTDALGGSYTIHWGGETVLPFEFGEPDKRVNLYPASIAFSAVGEFTLEDTYTVKLKVEKCHDCDELDGFDIVTGYGFDLVADIEEFNLGSIASGNLAQSSVPALSSEGNNSFDISASGIGKSIEGHFMYGPTITLYDHCKTTNKDFLCDDVQNYIELWEENIHIFNIVMTLAGEYGSYEYRTQIKINKGIYNVNLTSITLDKTSIVM